MRLAAGACVLVGLLGACTASRPDVELDGSVHYFIGGFPGTFSTLDLAVDGTARLQGAIEAGQSYDFTGYPSPSTLAALRGDIAAADLPDLSSEYTCADVGCDAPEPYRKVIAQAGGIATQIIVDGGTSNAALPDGLVRVLQDLDGIETELWMQHGTVIAAAASVRPEAVERR